MNKKFPAVARAASSLPSVLFTRVSPLTLAPPGPSSAALTDTLGAAKGAGVGQNRNQLAGAELVGASGPGDSGRLIPMT